MTEPTKPVREKDINNAATIYQMAVLARRLLAERKWTNEHGDCLVALREANARADDAIDKRDEARRLHDEHCDGYACGEPGDACVPPWRKP